MLIVIMTLLKAKRRRGRRWRRRCISIAQESLRISALFLVVLSQEACSRARRAHGGACPQIPHTDRWVRPFQRRTNRVPQERRNKIGTWWKPMPSLSPSPPRLGERLADPTQPSSSQTMVYTTQHQHHKSYLQCSNWAVRTGMAYTTQHQHHSVGGSEAEEEEEENEEEGEEGGRWYAPPCTQQSCPPSSADRHATRQVQGTLSGGPQQRECV